MTTISSLSILRSRNAHAMDHVMSTLLLRYPRWIHAEGRTHRLLSIEEGFEILARTPSLMEDPNLSRNASSSRAVPVQKLIDDILADPAVPLFWGKNIAGMQARDELGPLEKARAYDIWMKSMENAIAYAQQMCNLGIDDETNKVIGAHKQIVNRMLEPYSHITVVVSATEWTNFRGLRQHGDAEPHIHMLADAIGACLDVTDDIQDLQPGEWHLPMATSPVEIEDMKSWLAGTGIDSADVLLDCRKKLSVARCASTSFKTVEGFDMTADRAFALHDKLVASTPLHASPCEHQGQADSREIARSGWPRDWDHPHEHGNLVGFRQYRKMLPGEHIA